MEESLNPCQFSKKKTLSFSCTCNKSEWRLQMSTGLESTIDYDVLCRKTRENQEIKQKNLYNILECIAHIESFVFDWRCIEREKYVVYYLLYIMQICRGVIQREEHLFSRYIKLMKVEMK